MPVITPTSKVALAVAALVVGAAGLPITEAGARTGPQQSGIEASGVQTQPDATSAMASARSSGHRVEDLSKRTETIQSFANPNGSWTQETATEPVRTKDTRTGEWSDIDLTLEAAQGGFAPKSAMGGLLIPDGGTSTFAELAVEDASGRMRDLSWRWTGPLPAPVIEGSTATFKDVVENGDLVVTASSTGFRHDIVLREAPVAPLSFALPVVTGGPRVLEDGADGTLAITTRSGEELVTSPPPVMYDSSTDVTGEPDNVITLDTAVTPRADGTTLTLSPDAEFLSDPATQYPVTIDPQWNVDPSADTWTANQQPSTNYASSADLRVGTFNGGTNKTRSYLHFAKNSAIPYRGAKVTSAAINIRNFEAATCAGGQIHINRITTDWFADQVTWNNQGNIGVASPGTSVSTQAFGASGCGANWMNWDVTAMAQDWANGAPNYGVRVIALQETNNNSWRKFRSANSSDPAFFPRLIVNYSFPPDIPTSFRVSPIEAGTISASSPTLSAQVSDRDNDNVRLWWNLYDANDAFVTNGEGNVVGNGGTSVATIPAGTLREGQRYRLRAFAYDGASFSNGGNPGGAPIIDFTYDPLMASNLVLEGCRSECATSSPTAWLEPLRFTWRTEQAPSQDTVFELIVRKTSSTGSETTFESKQEPAATNGFYSWVPYSFLTADTQYEYSVRALSNARTTQTPWRSFKTGADQPDESQEFAADGGEQRFPAATQTVAASATSTVFAPQLDASEQLTQARRYNENAGAEEPIPNEVAVLDAAGTRIGNLRYTARTSDGQTLPVSVAAEGRTVRATVGTSSTSTEVTQTFVNARSTQNIESGDPVHRESLDGGYAVAFTFEEQCELPVEEREGNWVCPTTGEQDGVVTAQAQVGSHCVIGSCWFVEGDFYARNQAQIVFGFDRKDLGTVTLRNRSNMNGRQMRNVIAFEPTTEVNRAAIACEALVGRRGTRGQVPAKPDYKSQYEPIIDRNETWYPWGTGNGCTTFSEHSVNHVTIADILWEKDGYPGNWNLWTKTVIASRKAGDSRKIRRFSYSSDLYRDSVRSFWRATR